MSALETEFHLWRVAMGLHATPEQSDMLIRCQQLVADAFPAWLYASWVDDP